MPRALAVTAVNGYQARFCAYRARRWRWSMLAAERLQRWRSGTWAGPGPLPTLPGRQPGCR
jgi:hypothetical protein